MDRPSVGEDGGSASVAGAVLEKIHQLAVELDPLERSVLAALLTPGIAALFEADAETSGHGLVSWDDEALPRAVAAAVRRHRQDLVFGPS